MKRMWKPWAGLMAKQLNKVPIAGSVVKYAALELVAERSTGRRNGSARYRQPNRRRWNDEARRAEAATGFISDPALRAS